MTARIVKLVRYPLKGALGHARPTLPVNKTGIVGDRQYAFARRNEMPTAWAPKGKFYVGVNTPEMVAEAPYTEALEQPELNQSYFEGVKRRIDAQEFSLIDTKRAFTMTDSEEPYVSFLNLASVASLSAFMDTELDPARFRMNVWLEGLEPFEELDWVTSYPGKRAARIGKMFFRLEDMCERCKAIDASPVTRTYNLHVRDALVQLLTKCGYTGSPHRGVHAVMGFLGRPLDTGVMNVGDRMRLVEE